MALSDSDGNMTHGWTRSFSPLSQCDALTPVEVLWYLNSFPSMTVPALLDHRSLGVELKRD